MEKYTGRQIAILTDIHGLLEPTEAILDDIKRRGITEVYSLGDNIGEGPNPLEVVTLLENSGVKSIAGNAEEYVRLGIAPFPYVEDDSCLWTLEKLGEEGKGIVTLYPRFIELMVGGQKVGLCHFANDVRFNFSAHSTWTYQRYFDYAKTGERNRDNASSQFAYTNSPDERRFLAEHIKPSNINSPYMQGMVSAYREPLFNGRLIELYDAIIQGHVHWKLYDQNDKTKFYTIRAAGIAYRNDPVDTASYIILREKTNNQGFDVEEILVRYDRDKMVCTILNCTIPSDKMIRFTAISNEEFERHQK